MFGGLFSFWEGFFLGGGAMLNFEGVNAQTKGPLGWGLAGWSMITFRWNSRMWRMLDLMSFPAKWNLIGIQLPKERQPAVLLVHEWLWWLWVWLSLLLLLLLFFFFFFFFSWMFMRWCRKWCWGTVQRFIKRQKIIQNIAKEWKRSVL